MKQCWEGAELTGTCDKITARKYITSSKGKTLTKQKIQQYTKINVCMECLCKTGKWKKHQQKEENTSGQGALALKSYGKRHWMS